jgi:hypothetical protein
MQGVSFSEALQSKANQAQQRHPRQDAVETPATVDQTIVQIPGQSVQAPNINSLPLDNMIKALTVAEQIMTVQ